jgi:hypothetical protein
MSFQRQNCNNGQCRPQTCSDSELTSETMNFKDILVGLLGRGIGASQGHNLHRTAQQTSARTYTHTHTHTHTHFTSGQI